MAEREPQSAVLFDIALSPLRQRGIEFAARWSYVVLRDDIEHRFGFGDPKLYARLRFPSPNDSLRTVPRLHAAIEFSARLPTAKASLFPYANGGQELELQGIAGTGHWQTHLGVGRIWAEPRSGSGRTALDVPHATHLWVQVAPGTAGLRLELRTDLFLFEVKGASRNLFSGRLVHTGDGGFETSVHLEFDTSHAEERVFDALGSLRFATRFD